MEARDFRSIGPSAQEGLRRRALVLILQQGLSQAEAAQVVGLSEAIAAAEKQLGGKVVTGGLEVDADRLVYELLVSKDGGFTSAQVDPTTGAVGQAGEAELEPGKAVPPQGAKIDLGQAVRLTEAASGRKALEAGVEPREGAAVYVVEVVEDDEVSVHRVDPVSGAVSGED